MTTQNSFAISVALNLQKLIVFAKSRITAQAAEDFVCSLRISILNSPGTFDAHSNV